MATTTAKLSPAAAYAKQKWEDRRQAALDRINDPAIQAEVKRVQELYAQGAPRKAPVEVKPQFKQATTFTVTRLAGGAKASKAAEKAAATRRGRPLDMSPEAVAKREKRRARRAARKARKAAALG